MTSYHRFRALGCTAVVGADDDDRLAAAVAAAQAEIDACDLACSRFRADSELARLRPGGRPVEVSEWLCAAVATAVDAAAATDGLVDPTIGQCLVDLGYDRSFEHVDPSSPLVVHARHVPAWARVHADVARRRVTVPAGVRLDLGATAKALCADRAAAQAAAATGSGVLVSLGGDVAVAGDAPDGGWTIRVTDRADDAPEAPGAGQTVVIRTGGLATSGTAVRRWARGGVELHHLIDPRTGAPAAEAWRTVSVAAPSCTAANVAATAAVVAGGDAPRWLATRGHDARLVTPDGQVVRVGGWPADLPAGAAA
ncbi:MAG TPA: FAD:protein FMN transferase [Acidimicrobiales bacterium]|nr:FAD:protein FMN transferase [Acidimicrobiales bacterium]